MFFIKKFECLYDLLNPPTAFCQRIFWKKTEDELSQIIETILLSIFSFSPSNSESYEGNSDESVFEMFVQTVSKTEGNPIKLRVQTEKWDFCSYEAKLSAFSLSRN